MRLSMNNLHVPQLNIWTPNGPHYQCISMLNKLLKMAEDEPSETLSN